LKLFNLFDNGPEPDEERDLLEDIMTGEEIPDSPREKVKTEKAYYRTYTRSMAWTQNLVRVESKGFRIFYLTVAVISCAVLIGMLLFTISFLPRYRYENPQPAVVVKRYVENGLQETGAINIVTGIILDYRAFDTLGESHVLFTALMCVTVLLRMDSKNMRRQFEDFYMVRNEKYHELYRDPIISGVAIILLPCLFMYGAYVLLNGQNSPGGGFSGGTVLGSALIIFAAAYGFMTTDRVFTNRVAAWISFSALGFYSFAKGYVFFTGANGIENHIPKGEPGAILSGGLILPLDIAVGLVVACTMFGFYSLFRRGSIGQDV
jgi:multicomponent Na+:H+ antiporter subunit B